MTQYVGLSLRDIYVRKCDELHCKKNSHLLELFPTKPDLFEVPTAIDMSKNFIGAKGLLALLEVVRCCSGLMTLDLRDQQMTNESVDEVCSVLLRHPSIVRLNLGHNPISIAGGRALLDLVKVNTVIEFVGLDHTDVRPVVTNAIDLQLSRNKKVRSHAKPVAAANVDADAADDGAEQGVRRTIDLSIVRQTLDAFPTSVNAILFDEDVADALSTLCVSHDALFFDTQFSAEAFAIQRNNGKEFDVADWRRVAAQPGAKIFPDGDQAVVKPDSIPQTMSWVFTSLFSCSTPEDIRGMISPDVVSSVGVYTVRFFIDGKWRYVVVDDFLPVKTSGEWSFCAPGTGDCFWPCILEKAVAKLHGCYQAIDQDVASRHPMERRISCATTMCDFSSGVGISRDLHHEEFNADAWWGSLMELHASNTALVAASGSDEANPVMTALGVEPNHAFQILHVRQINGFRLLHLQSTYATKEWTGEWSTGSPLWEQYADIATALGYSYASDRLDKTTFWIPYVKFLQCFSAVHMCRSFQGMSWRLLEGEWTRSTSGGPYFEPTWSTNPRYKLSMTTRGQAFVSLSVPDTRFHDSEVDTLAFHILNGDYFPVRYDKDNVTAKTSYVITNAVSYDGVLNEGDYWVVPSSYVMGQMGRFIVRVFASVPFAVSHERQNKYWKQCDELCRVECSGEYQNGEDNPQFALTIPSDVAPARLLVQMHTPETEQLSMALFLCQNGNSRLSERVLGSIPDDSVVCKSRFIISNTVTLDTKIPGGSEPFIVVPCISPEKTSANVRFTFWCSHPKFSVKALPLWRKKTLEVEWERSGGYQETERNPQLELLTPIPNQTFVVRMEVISTSDPSSIFFVVRNQGRQGDGISGHIDDDAIVCKSTYVRHHTVVKEFSNGARPCDSYIIVPCLQPPGSKAKCIITVTSLSEDFQLREVHPPEL
jgi:hypothetical protein